MPTDSAGAEQLLRQVNQYLDDLTITSPTIAGDTDRGFHYMPLGTGSGSGFAPLGSNVVPGPPPVTGACCIGSDCSIRTSSDCTSAGGTYQGDGSLCTPNPCSLPTCPCGGYPGFHNPADGQYYTTRIDDSCAGMSTYSGLVPAGVQYQSLVTTETGCDAAAGGTITCHWDVCSGLVDCVGEVDCLTTACGPVGSCMIGCAFPTTCQYQCGEGAPPHIRNVQTYSNPCMPG